MYKITNLTEVIDKLDKSAECAFDTETDGFYGTIELAQFHQRGWDEVLMVRKPNPFHLAAILQEQPFVCHTAHYDITTIQQQTGTAWIPKHFDDTFYAARLHYYTQDSFSLDNVMQYVFHRDHYKELGIDKKKMQDADWSGELSDQQLLYAALDVYYLLQVWEAVHPATAQFNYDLDILFTRNCLNFQWNGFPILSDAMEERYESNLREIAALNLPINPQSWQQVRTYCDMDKSDALALLRAKLGENNERAGDCVKAKKLLKQNSFIAKFIETAQDGLIFGKFLPSTRSGRCASKDQNLQQIPRKTKNLFGLPEDNDDEVLLYVDFSQLELRGVTVITNERRMDKLFRSGEDIHGHTTAEMITPNYDAVQRHVGKTCNFNLTYGGSADTLNDILVKESEILLPYSETKRLKKSWLRLWPDIAQWQRKGINAWRNGQPWQTPLGRRYMANLMTDQLNIQVQGFGAEVAKLAMHYMHKELGDFSSHEHKLRNFVHDSWVFTCPNNPDIYTELAHVIAKSMQLSWSECCKSTKIKDLPMPVDVFVGRNWGNIEDDHVAHFHFD